MNSSDTFDPVTIDPAETFKVLLDLFDICANFWTPNELYALGEFIRPRLANGFSYECTTPGTSSRRDPFWPRTVGETVVDGSIVWTCRAADYNGLLPITNVSAVSNPTGLTITAVSASEATKILASYSSASVDRDFEAVFSFTLNGANRVARQPVKIRRR